MVKVVKHGVILKPTSRAFERRAVLNPGVFQEGEYVHVFYRAINPEGKSCIGHAKLKGPTRVVWRCRSPIFRRLHAYESRGVEDPRVVKLDGTYYMTYVAHDGKNAITA